MTDNTEKIILLCSLCDKEIETTHGEFTKRGSKCWLCGHGDLSIIFGEYSELALAIYRAAEALKKLPPSEARRLAEPITDLLKRLEQ